MKRFMYDTKINDVVKIGKQVAYGPELEIPTSMSPYPFFHLTHVSWRYEIADVLAPALARSPRKYQLIGGKEYFNVTKCV